MRKRLVVFLGVVFVFGILVGIASAADKFAYIDLSRAFSEYFKTKDYDKSLGKKEDVYTTEKNEKLNEFKAYQDKLNLLTDKQKEVKRPEVELKIKEIQEWDRKRQVDLRKEQDEKMKEIVKDIEGVVKQYSEKEGITMVFSEKALVYQTKSLDITDKIIEILNKKIVSR
ncbi:MAG: OmpH family outer membrane protein [Candidatus Omnitrophota bacterium]|nr:OmpH family outer membrane protein [Candidatus Omnitrophota bacterium]